MSLGFKTKFDQMRAGNPTTQSNDLIAGDDYYAEVSHSRSICFIWPDGKRMFLNYSYLVCGDYCPADECINLTFTSHHIHLQGTLLEKLFEEIMEQTIRRIVAVDERYRSIEVSSKPAVYLIKVTKHEA